MNKIIFSILTGMLLAFTANAVAAQTCPKGMVNDPYPGSCGAYTDANDDKICDYSQTDAELNQNSGEKPATENANTADSASGGAAACAITNSPQVKPTVNYYSWQIAAVLTAAYVLSLMAVKTRKLSLSAQRKVWNAALLILFAATAATSLAFLLKMQYGITVSLPFNLSFWHIEAGIAMTVTAILHAFWHLPYYGSYFRK